MSVLLFASFLVIKFPGGTPNEFVSSLADATGQNIVLSQGEANAIKKVEFETKDLGEMSRILKAQTGHVILPGVDMVLSTQRLHPKLVRDVVSRGGAQGGEITFTEAIPMPPSPSQSSSREGGFSVNFISFPPTALAEGKFTFKTEKQDAIQLTSFQGMTTKPIKVHWIFRETPIYMNVKGLPELDMLKWAGKAVGARLIQNTKEFNLDIDPTEIRKRAVATLLYEEEQVRPFEIRPDEGNALLRSRRTSASFRISVLNALSAAQITTALETPGGSVTIDLTPRSPLTAIALQRIRELERAQQSLPASSPAPRPAVGLLQRVDPNRMPTMTVTSRFSVRMDIPVLDANGMPAGSVRF